MNRKSVEKIDMEEKVGSVLKNNKLSVTESRKRILGLFFINKGALSHGDIEKKEGDRFDRVTIYRTLQTFVDKGVIHAIPTSDNSILYALCKDDCREGHHHDHHVHFICTRCNKTFCLDDVVTPRVKLPQGYEASQVEVVVEGVCKDCRKKQ